MNRPLLAGTAVLVTLGLALVAGWAVFVRPFRVLPRSAEAIQADWQALEPQLQHVRQQTPIPTEVFRIDADPSQATPEQIQALLDALDQGARIPVGCHLLAGVQERPLDPAPMQVFHVARALIEHGEPRAAAQLGADLLEGDFFSVAVAIPILNLAREAGADPTPPTREHARHALLVEAACGDAMIDLLDSPDAPKGADGLDEMLDSALFDLGISRARFRDRMMRILGCLDDTDPQSCLAALPPTNRYAPLTQVLVPSPASVSEVLSSIDAWSIQPAQ